MKMSMPEVTDAAVFQPERNLGTESLHQKLTQGKEIADLRSKLDSFQSFLSQGDFYSRGVTNSGVGENVHLGDYGNIPRFTQDYLLDRIFQTIGARDEGGNPLSTDSLRSRAASSTDESPQLRFKGEDQSIVDIDFFAGKDAVNFNSWLRGLSEEKKAKIISSLESIPPRIWAETIVQQLSEQQGQILEHEGIFAMPIADWTSPTLISDFTYFLNQYEFGPRFGWTRAEVETILNNGTIPKEKGPVDTWVEPAINEAWYVLSTRAMEGVSLAFKKGESGIAARILVDTAELRGRNLHNSFLSSQTAKELLSVFDKLGLEPSDEMLHDFTEGSLGYGHYSSRYGNGYADLSRLVTYVVREGLDRDRLVHVRNPNFTAESLLKETENLSAPAKLILKMMAGMMKRSKPPVDQPLHVGSFSGHSIRDGSCKDSEVYFSNSVKLGRGFRDGIFICKSGYGADTRINVASIMAGGIEFPQGYLFRAGEEGKLEPLRATMYCFNNTEASDAFGWQYDEGLSNDPSLKQAIDSFPAGWNIPVVPKAN